MWGPGIAALVTLFVFRSRHQRTITFFGTAAAKSLLFYLVPMLGLAITLPLATDEMETMTLLVVLVGQGFARSSAKSWAGAASSRMPFGRCPSGVATR